jgi:RNase H-like domain found in reverse transcriptase
MTSKLEALNSLSERQLAAMSRPKLFGLLNYYRGYVPDFTIRVEPLRLLLARPHLPWEPQQTAAVKDLVARILSGIPLINFDPASPLRVETHTGDEGLVGVLLQKDPKSTNYLPIASHSRFWTTKELQQSKLQLEAVAIQQTLSNLNYITAFASQIVVPCTPEFKVLYKSYPSLHPKLCAQLLDI